MRRFIGLVVVLAALLLSGRAEAQSINYYPAGGGGTDWALSAPLVWDEFLSGVSAVGQVGSLGWGYSGCSAAQLEGETNRPGIYRFGCGASVAGGAALMSGQYFLKMSNLYDIYGIARWGTGANKPDKRFGAANTALSNPPGQGVRFECLAADTNWFAVTKDAGGTETRVDTGVVFAGTTWYRLRIMHPSATSYTYYINDALVATITANLPAENATAQVFFSTVTTGTALDMDVDYFRLQMSVSR